MDLREDLGESVILDTPLAETDTTKKVIRHLVLAGGGTAGLVAFGALKATEKQKVWSRQEIVSIDATSAGTVLAVIVALGYDWEEAETYFVKRPWHHVLKSDLYSILGAMDQRGIWTMEIMEQILTPLLLAKNLGKDATLLDLYEATHIDVHFYTVAMMAMCELVDLSHKTHPTWTVVEAVYASCCVPVLFAPLFKDGVGYVDGGMLLNYPLRYCLDRPEVDPATVFGITKTFEPISPVQSTSNLFEYMLYLMNQMILSSWHRQKHREALYKIGHEIFVTSRQVTSMDLLQLSSSETLRQTLVDEGVALVISFQPPVC